MTLVERINTFIEKGRFKPGLVQVPIQVKQGNRVFTRMQWKRPKDIAQEIGRSPSHVLIEEYGNMSIPQLTLLGRKNLNMIHSKIESEYDRMSNLKRTHTINNDKDLVESCESSIRNLSELKAKVHKASLLTKR